MQTDRERERGTHDEMSFKESLGMFLQSSTADDFQPAFFLQEGESDHTDFEVFRLSGDWEGLRQKEAA